MADEARPVVGFIGLGRMGLPMCRNLLAAGVPLIVFNRTRAKAEALREEGARAADSVAALAAECDVVIACLDTVAASAAIFLDEDGVIAHARRGALLIDHATIAPELTVHIAQAANARGPPDGDERAHGRTEPTVRAEWVALAVGHP